MRWLLLSMLFLERMCMLSRGESTRETRLTMPRELLLPPQQARARKISWQKIRFALSTASSSVTFRAECFELRLSRMPGIRAHHRCNRVCCLSALPRSLSLYIFLSLSLFLCESFFLSFLIISRCLAQRAFLCLCVLSVCLSVCLSVSTESSQFPSEQHTCTCPFLSFPAAIFPLTTAPSCRS